MTATHQLLQPAVHAWRRDAYLVSTDPRLLDLDVIHGYLVRSYWSPGIPRDVVAQAIQHSFCFGLYATGQATGAATDQGIEKQIGFARTITDFTTFAYLCDVFVLPRWQVRGLGTWLVQCVVQAPSLAGVRTVTLRTRDAHGLYRKLGFGAIVVPENSMVLQNDMTWYRAELADTHQDQGTDNGT